MSIKILAQCRCGEVTFKSTAEPVIQLSCHCADCRDATHQDFSNIAFFKMNTTEVTGELTQKNYMSDSGNKTQRDACASCGTLMFDTSEGFPGLKGVFSQHIQAPFVSDPKCHVWVESKLPETELPSNSVQYRKGLN